MKVYVIVLKANKEAIWKNKFYKSRKNAEKILSQYSAFGNIPLKKYWTIKQIEIKIK